MLFLFVLKSFVLASLNILASETSIFSIVYQRRRTQVSMTSWGDHQWPTQNRTFCGPQCPILWWPCPTLWWPCPILWWSIPRVYIRRRVQPSGSFFRFSKIRTVLCFDTSHIRDPKYWPKSTLEYLSAYKSINPEIKKPSSQKKRLPVPYFSAIQRVLELK